MNLMCRIQENFQVYSLGFLLNLDIIYYGGKDVERKILEMLVDGFILNVLCLSFLLYVEVEILRRQLNVYVLYFKGEFTDIDILRIVNAYLIFKIKNIGELFGVKERERRDLKQIFRIFNIQK